MGTAAGLPLRNGDVVFTRFERWWGNIGGMAGDLDTRAAVVRLLERTGFGAGADDVDAAARAGFDAAVAQVLEASDDPGVSATPPPALEPLPKRNNGDRDSVKKYQAVAREQRVALTMWWLDRMAAARRPWVEKRTLLWHDHWATSIQKVKSGALMLRQYHTLRRLGGGDFRALARAMVRDPALMIWLDAGGNTARSPNENLARELMELFTLGVGHYTENDVKEAAKVLTGWRANRYSDRVEFRERQHARGKQTVLGVTADLTDQSLVDLLVARPDSPRFVATRLWKRLVSATPPAPSTLDKLVSAYGAGRDVTAMVRAMLLDPAFRDPVNVLVKQPVEYVVGAMRVLGLRPGKLPGPQRKALLAQLDGLGQVPFAPPDVSGWPANETWLTTSAARVRLGLMQRLVIAADLSTVERVGAGERVAAVGRMLGVGTWTPRTRAVLGGAVGDPKKLMVLALTAPEYVVSR